MIGSLLFRVGSNRWRSSLLEFGWQVLERKQAETAREVFSLQRHVYELYAQPRDIR